MIQSPWFAVVFWLVLLPALWASGSLAASGLRVRSPLFSGILKLGLGVGVYAYFLVLAGSVGWLKPGAVLCFFALSLLLGWRTGMGVFRWLKDALRFFVEPKDAFSRICQFSLLGTFFFTALFCFLPEIANDALAIQLYVAKLFVRNASVAPSFYDIASYRPLLMSVLYSTGLLFQNVAIAKIFHWVSGILLVCALSVKVEEISQNKKLALFLGLMFWLTPTLMNQITTTYIDAAVSLFVFLGYCVVADAFEDLAPAPFFYGGLMIGLAVAARSLSLGAFFVILIMLGFRGCHRGVKFRVMIAGACLAGGVFLTSSYWFLRDWVYTGNPVYPFMGKLFGTEDFSLFSSIYFHGMGLPRSLGSFLSVPWDITFRPKYFDYHHWVGPFYLSVLPFFLYAAIKIKKARIHLQFVLFFTVFWYFTGQNVRYLLPALPVYLLAAGVGLQDFSATYLQVCRWRGLVAKTVASLAIVSLLSLTIYHFRYQFLPIFRLWSCSKYHEKLERTIPISRWANQYLPQNAKILILGEVHLFDFDRPVVLDFDFDVRTHYTQQKSSAAMAALLKEKGITHIVDMVPWGGQNLKATDLRPVHPPIDLILKDGKCVKIEKKVDSENVQGARYQYTLYSLT